MGLQEGLQPLFQSVLGLLDDLLIVHIDLDI